MKPLPAAPLTPEDEYIWGWVHGGWFRRFDRFPAETFGPDRRDADLMLTAQQWRFGPIGAIYVLRGADDSEINIRGAYP